MSTIPYFHTWCGLSANLECMSEMCCTRLAGNTGCKKSPFWHHRTTLSGYIFGNKACIDNRKKLVKHQSLLHMVNFGLLTAEICWRVWGTPANFNGFHVLAALKHGTQQWVVGVSQTAALNRGRHLYLAGRPSRWALAHIIVAFSFKHIICRPTGTMSAATFFYKHTAYTTQANKNSQQINSCLKYLMAAGQTTPNNCTIDRLINLCFSMVNRQVYVDHPISSCMSCRQTPIDTEINQTEVHKKTDSITMPCANAVCVLVLNF